MPEQDPVSRIVIGKAMEAHTQLGPGLNELFYHQLLMEKLTASGVEHEFKPRRELVYRGFVADVFEPNLLVANHLIPELKALRGTFVAEHFTQLLSYLKVWKLQVGMLFDFAKESLIFKRIGFTEKQSTFPVLPIPGFVSNKALAEQLLIWLSEILRDHGLGYRASAYRGLLTACLRERNLQSTLDPSAHIQHLGVAPLRCIQVDGQCVVGITALGDGLSAADRAVVQTYLRWLKLPWGIAVHFGKSSCDIRFVSPPENSGRAQIPGT